MRSLKLKATLLTNNCLAICISRTYFSHKSIAYVRIFIIIVLQLLLHTNSLQPYSYRGNSKKISIFLVSITDPFVFGQLGVRLLVYLLARTVGFFSFGKPNVSFVPIFLDLLLNSDVRNCVFFILLFNCQFLGFFGFSSLISVDFCFSILITYLLMDSLGCQTNYCHCSQKVCFKLTSFDLLFIVCFLIFFVGFDFITATV